MTQETDHFISTQFRTRPFSADRSCPLIRCVGREKSYPATPPVSKNVKLLAEGHSGVGSLRLPDGISLESILQISLALIVASLPAILTYLLSERSKRLAFEREKKFERKREA